MSSINVTLYQDLANNKPLADLADRFGVEIVEVITEQIPGSFWGAPEAGLIENKLYVRHDTPIHSLLHELCHYICMSPSRRENLHTDAGGRVAVEENAVCYLQLLLADQIPSYSREKLFSDMDSWGYSFRLGSTAAWFAEDAEDAIDFLLKYFLIDSQSKPTFRVNLDHTYTP